VSTIVVTPPAAAARVAVSKPSHSVRPGSFTWTCVSTTPGSRAALPTSKRLAASGALPCPVTAVITPPEITTSAAPTPCGVATLVLEITRSTGGGGIAGRRYVRRRERRQMARPDAVLTGDVLAPLPGGREYERMPIPLAIALAAQSPFALQPCTLRAI